MIGSSYSLIYLNKLQNVKNLDLQQTLLGQKEQFKSLVTKAHTFHPSFKGSTSISLRKHRMACSTAIPLVYMFTNSITLVLASSWNSSPSDNSMNIITTTTTGLQSAPILSPSPCHSLRTCACL